MKNLHFHVLFTDGVFSPKSNGELRFHRVNAPTSKEPNALVAMISERVARYLERQEHPARDGWPEMSCSDHLNLLFDDEEGDTLQQLQGHSITYRIAMGPQAGRIVLSVYQGSVIQPITVSSWLATQVVAISAGSRFSTTKSCAWAVPAPPNYMAKATEATVYLVFMVFGFCFCLCSYLTKMTEHHGINFGMGPNVKNLQYCSRGLPGKTEIYAGRITDPIAAGYLSTTHCLQSHEGC